MKKNNEDLKNYKEINHFNSDEKHEQWGYGEWIEEPDEVTFSYKDYDCKIKRIAFWDGNPPKLGLGYLCGYVKIPRTHVFHGKDVFKESKLLDVDVHGGLTFGKYDKEKEWWIGFDCGHGWDIIPMVEKCLELTKSIKISFPNLLEGPSYKNIRFCINECKSLVDQLIALKPCTQNKK